MQVRSGYPAGRAGNTYLLIGADCLTLDNEYLRKVHVNRENAHAMINDDHIALKAEPSLQCDNAIIDGPNRSKTPVKTEFFRLYIDTSVDRSELLRQLQQADRDSEWRNEGAAMHKIRPKIHR